MHIHRFADRLEDDPLPGSFGRSTSDRAANPLANDEGPPASSESISQQPSMAAPPPTLKATGETTAIGSSLKQALLAYAGMPLAGVLIVSDGQSTSGEPVESAAKLAADEGVPVVTLAVGTPEGPRNARIVKVETSPVAFVSRLESIDRACAVAGDAGRTL